MEENQKKAIVLLSGGIDSATTTAYAIKDGFAIYAITFSYGQKHRSEIGFAERLCNFFKITNHIIINIPAHIFSSSSLSSESENPVPKNRNIFSIGTTSEEIPSTYVPGRNILFLSYALSFAESIGAGDIFIGANAVDYSGYPDCRPEFLKSFEAMANIGTKAGLEGNGFTIHAPLITLKKSEIIKQGISMGVDYSLTQSCYDPDNDGSSCGECDSCQIRKRGFFEAGIKDPTDYRK
jgi:7-cyano-7-deazaguanine synthase